VILENDKGELVSRQRTAFDGFFLFAGVPPGKYQLRLGEDMIDRVVDAPDEIFVNSDGGIKRGLDFVLKNVAQRTLVDSTEIRQNSASFVPASEQDSAPTIEPFLSGEPAIRSEPQEKVAAQGNWVVQLGAFSLQESAESYWRELSDSQSDLIEDFQARYREAGGLTRLILEPASSEEAARALCDELKGQGVDCLVKDLGD
jgi:hypothetical protein